MDRRTISAFTIAVLGVLPSGSTVCQEVIDEGWSVGVVGSGSRPAFDFGPADDLHVVAVDFGELGTTSWYAKATRVQGPWSKRNVATGDYYMPGDLVVDTDGVVHALYHNHDTEDADHLVVTRSGGITVTPVATPGSHDGWDNSLALDGAGVLHMAAVDPVDVGGVRSLEYGTFDGKGWTFGSTSIEESFISGPGVSLALDSAGAPRIAYCAARGWFEPGALSLAVEEGGDWAVLPVVEGEGRGRFPSLAIDDQDRPHVAWLDVDPDDRALGEVRYAVLDGEEWAIETVGDLADLDLGIAGARRSVSLVLDAEQAPHIAFGDTRVVKYATRGPDGWDITPVATIESSSYGGLVVLRLDSTGRPAIAFWQGSPSGDVVCVAARKGEPAREFNRGDANASGRMDIADPSSVLNFLFLGGPPPLCREAADANNDGGINIADGSAMLNFLFLGGPPPADPGPPSTGCGPDPDPSGSEKDLGCEVYEGCAP